MHAICTTPRRAPWPWIVGAAALMGALVLSACSTPRAPEGVVVGELVHVVGQPLGRGERDAQAQQEGEGSANLWGP